MGCMNRGMLMVILVPPTVYHMILSYPPTISSKATYIFLKGMDWSKVLTSKSHKRVGLACSLRQIMGRYGQPTNTMNDFLLSLPFKIGSCTIITLMGITMLILSIFGCATWLICMVCWRRIVLLLVVRLVLIIMMTMTTKMMTQCPHY